MQVSITQAHFLFVIVWNTSYLKIVYIVPRQSMKNTNPDVPKGTFLWKIFFFLGENIQFHDTNFSYVLKHTAKHPVEITAELKMSRSKENYIFHFFLI